MKNLPILLFLVGLIFVNGIFVAWLTKTEIKEYTPYNDTVLIEKINLLDSLMQENINKNALAIDSMKKIIYNNNQVITAKLNNINSLKRKIDELKKSMDYSSVTNDSLHRSITNHIKQD